MEIYETATTPIWERLRAMELYATVTTPTWARSIVMERLETPITALSAMQRFP